MLSLETDQKDVFFGESASALIDQMRRTALGGAPTAEEYMRGVAHRVHQMTGRTIRMDPEGFLVDLEDVGLVRLETAH